MKKMHVTELTDGEFSAAFQAAAKDAVERIRVRGEQAPSMSLGADKKQPPADRTAPVRMGRKKAVA